MKSCGLRYLSGLALAALTVFGFSLDAGWAQTSAFVYQGRLLDQSQPANGNYDFSFRLMDAGTNGNPIGPLRTQAPVAVSNGLFQVTLDFGGGPFNGQTLWLEIGVRTNGSASSYVTLLPRQLVASAPYATFASNASIAALATSTVPGALLAGNGATITNLSGWNIMPGTVTSNTIDAATDAAYRSGSSFATVYSTPQLFGAKGDGVTDDTVALQNWLADASFRNKIALLPPAPGGYYKITGELSVSNGLYLAGAAGGKHATSGAFLSKCHIRQFTPGQNALHLYNAVDSIHIDNVVISADSPTDYLNAGCGIFLDGGTGDSDCSILEQCLVMGFGIGVNATSEANSSFRACSFGWNGIGVRVSGVANNVTLESCQLSYNYGRQVYAVAADNLIIKGCDIAAETPGSQGVYLQDNVSLLSIGNRFEDYSTNTMLVSTTSGPWWGPQITIFGTKFYNFSGALRYSMAFTNCYWITMMDIYYDAVNTNGLGIVVNLPPFNGNRVYAVPPVPYLRLDGPGNIETNIATMSDPDPSKSLSVGSPGSGPGELFDFDSFQMWMDAQNPTSQNSPQPQAIGRGRESKVAANKRGKEVPRRVAGPLTTNLTLKAGMQLCISNGVIIQVK